MTPPFNNDQKPLTACFGHYTIGHGFWSIIITVFRGVFFQKET